MISCSDDMYGTMSVPTYFVLRIFFFLIGNSTGTVPFTDIWISFFHSLLHVMTNKHIQKTLFYNICTIDNFNISFKSLRFVHLCRVKDLLSPEVVRGESLPEGEESLRLDDLAQHVQGSLVLTLPWTDVEFISLIVLFFLLPMVISNNQFLTSCTV